MLYLFIHHPYILFDKLNSLFKIFPSFFEVIIFLVWLKSWLFVICHWGFFIYHIFVSYYWTKSFLEFGNLTFHSFLEFKKLFLILIVWINSFLSAGIYCSNFFSYFRILSLNLPDSPVNIRNLLNRFCKMNQCCRLFGSQFLFVIDLSIEFQNSFFQFYFEFMSIFNNLFNRIPCTCFSLELLIAYYLPIMQLLGVEKDQ